jgi:hypothetical protein
MIYEIEKKSIQKRTRKDPSQPRLTHQTHHMGHEFVITS